MTPAEETQALLAAHGVNLRAPLQPLSGGVSCDVFRAELADGAVVCVKRALPRLRVAADWRASARRSHNEVLWLEAAQGVPAVLAPKVLMELPDAHLFLMSWFEPSAHPVWKAELAAGRVDLGFARKVGAALGAVHAHAARTPGMAANFNDYDGFENLRVGPYLREAARRHPDLAPTLLDLCNGLASTRISLVHGDVSPKNILTGAERPILLDAECAVWSDPAFDLAFCLNHLLLKTVWLPAGAHALLAAFTALRGAYLAEIDFTDPAALDARAARILAGLLLARIDGKSPVEYLTAPGDKEFVRTSARQFLKSAPPGGLEGLARAWAQRIGQP